MLSKALLVIHAVLLCMALTPVPATADDDDSPARAASSPSLAAAREAVRKEDFESAVRHLNVAVKETPNDADVHNLLGYSHRKLGKVEAAFEHYRLALKIDPKHRGAHEYIGELYLELDRLADAQKHLAALDKACFFGCSEYNELKDVIENYQAKRGNTR